MKLPGKTGLYVSLAAILSYWTYKVMTAIDSVDVPDNFSDFVIHVSLVKVGTMSAIALLLWIEPASWHELGLTFEYWKKRVFSGTWIGFVLFVLLNVVLSSILASVISDEAHSGSAIDFLFKDSRKIFIWMLIGIFGGGLVEELARIFVLTRFEKTFGSAGLYFALICSSIVFGLGHMYQGNSTAISTGVSGLVMGLIYICRRSTLEIITVHAVSDMLAISAAFLLGGVS